jgi:hypothetical protein
MGPSIGPSWRQGGIGPSWREGGLGPSRLEEGPATAEMLSFTLEDPGTGGVACRASNLTKNYDRLALKIYFVPHLHRYVLTEISDYLAAPSNRSRCLPPPIKSGSTVKLQLEHF